MAKDGILLESGTNEVEILEFVLDDQHFGVNVLKIQAIEQFDPARVTRIQLAHPSVVGTLLFRDSCITLVDLTKEMNSAPDREETVEPEISRAVDTVTTSELEDGTPAPVSEAASTSVDTETGESSAKLVLVMEFNDMKTAFLVDGVNRIHRVSWESISPLSAFLSSTDSKFTGSLQIDGREILVDPGIGFGKTLAHNTEIIRRLPVLASLGRPVLTGCSRKSLIQHALGLPVGERLNATLALNVLSIAGRASIIRVHDVKEAAEAAAMADATLFGRRRTCEETGPWAKSSPGEH